MDGNQLRFVFDKSRVLKKSRSFGIGLSPETSGLIRGFPKFRDSSPNCGAEKPVSFFYFPAFLFDVDSVGLRRETPNK